MEKLTLTVVTPEQSVLDKITCDSVTLPAEGGEIGILPKHTPLITLLGVGLVTYRDGQAKRSVAVRKGFAEIAADTVRVLADRAVSPDQVDTTAARRELATFERKRMDVVGVEQLTEVNEDAAFVEACLSIAASK
ncbi:MAG: ATP synthase F1 subunit epsilon [Acidobacteria bacterium]|nr:ATP synthase F1 subunit epsilon [Acidobacteriota bacterium]MCG3192964.1 ATP synthase epsilon chain [Thermoanaerobaculia bacterium]MCK6683800.1 ATP synthase F1 subunit epsilon [Thermoanaerobaculia bacterium]